MDLFCEPKRDYYKLSMSQNIVAMPWTRTVLIANAKRNTGSMIPIRCKY